MKKLILLSALLGASFLFLAPAYNTIVPDCTAPGAVAACLYPGQNGLFFKAERPAASTRSQQFQIPFSASQPQASLSVECIWASDPGAFEYDVQRTDTDATGNYITIASAGVMSAAAQNNGGGNFISTTDLSPWRGSYISLYAKTQTVNAVNGTCKVTR